MQAFSTFSIAFLFSFLGTIPPGTLNLTVIHLGVNDRIRAALVLSVTAALVEYPYAWLAVEFQDYIRKSTDVMESFRLVGSILMIAIGVLNLLSTLGSSSNHATRLRESGFRMGVILGVLNPVAIPFWIAMTAYMKSRGWIALSDNLQLQAYLLGVSLGTLAVFIPLACVAKRVVSRFKISTMLSRLPGALLILLGVYTFGEYIFG